MVDESLPALDPPSAAAVDPAVSAFLARLHGSGDLAALASPPPWTRLVLAKPSGPGLDSHAPEGAAGATRVVVRPLRLRGQLHLSFVFSHTTQDITKNLPWCAGLRQIEAVLGRPYRNAHLFSDEGEVQLSLSKRGRGHISIHKAERDAPGDAQRVAAAHAGVASHDRPKQRWLAQDRPFLSALGVTNPEHQLVPAMARKWKQINKFLEVLDLALQRADLLHSPDPKGATEADASPLRVVDFGAGKAYLTFAVHDWLTHTRGLTAEVTGFELRADLVQQGQAVIDKLGLHGLHIQQGDVRMAQPPAMDVMIALHACDTATDHAIHLGLRASAKVIVCSPCCHKELRPQLLSPHPLKSVFQHGIHAEQTAEMVTDSLRALLLQAQGYDTQVFEFVALEHTRKNKMILAVKRDTVPHHDGAVAQAHGGAADPTMHKHAEVLRAQARAQVQELKSFFGLREQCLEALLQSR